MDSPYILYGTDHSYFTAKIRPYLRYKGIPYKEKLSSLLAFQRFIIPRTGTRFIPVVHTPDDIVVQDTTDIIDFLEQRFPDKSVYPDTPKQKLVALLFELYGDEWFTLPAMHYRWSYLKQQQNYVYEAFGDVAGIKLPAPIKRLVGKEVSKPFKGALKPLGISDKTIPAIEAWYDEFLSSFNDHLARHDYLLGSRPCIGDFALAGPMYAHMWRDPVPSEKIRLAAPYVEAWLKRINKASHLPGAFLPNDEVPETLLPMLRHLFKEQWPLLEDTALQLEQWVANHPEKQRISRAIGEHELIIGDAKEKRLVFPYAQWMMQRPLKHYQSLTADERRSVDQLLVSCDGLEAMNFNVPQPVVRRNNQLVVEKS